MRVLTEPAPDALARRVTPWGDLATRAASALVLLPLVVGCIWWGGGAWSSLIALGAVTLAAEWWAMCRAGRLGVSWLGAGVAYIAAALLSLAWLRADPSLGRLDVLFLLVVIWATDIGAYLAGRAIGGARLAPAISPGKTWSGTLGGTLAAVIAAAAVAWGAGHRPSLSAGVLALVVSVAAQGGDLLESAAKRLCGVKDSGRLIPGHGGLADRVDGVLLAAPVMALVELAFGRGIVLWN